MTLTVINCQYCTAENQLQNVERTTTDKVALKLYEYQEANKILIPENTVECPYCNRKYEIIRFPNFLWVKNKLKPTDSMLEKLKILFPNSSLDEIYVHITGVTKPELSIGERVRRQRHYHVCFELNGTRAYVDCQEIRLNGSTVLRGLDIFEA